MKARHATNGVSQLCYGVIGCRQRAVSTFVGYLESEGLIELFARLDSAKQALAVLDLGITRVDVERERGVDEVAVILEQPIHPIISASAFLSRREREYQRSLRCYVVPFHAEQRLCERCSAVLDVTRSSAVEKAEERVTSRTALQRSQ